LEFSEDLIPRLAMAEQSKNTLLQSTQLHHK